MILMFFGGIKIFVPLAEDLITGSGANSEFSSRVMINYNKKSNFPCKFELKSKNLKNHKDWTETVRDKVVRHSKGFKTPIVSLANYLFEHLKFLSHFKHIL